MTDMYNKVEFFRTYFSKATEKTILVELLEKRFKPSTARLKILDLGCHDGALMEKIFTAYKDRLPTKIKLVGVEPSKNALEELLKKDFIKHTEVETFIGKAEDYFNHHSDQYDWVFASQCLYWSKNLNDIVNKINQTGKSSLIILRGKKGIFEIQSKFKHLLGNNDEQLYTAENIEHTLLSQKIPYKKEEKTTFIKLPPLNSLEFKWLISFFLQTDEKNITDEIYLEVQNFVTRHSISQIQHDVVFFWLGKARLIL